MKNVYIFLAEGFEEIEALTVVDLLRRAEIEIKMVSMADAPYVTGSHAITVQADVQYSQVDFEGADMLVLPGGPGHKKLMSHENLCVRLKKHASLGKRIAAICAAPAVLGKLGLLKGKKAVCYPGFEGDLAGADVLYKDSVTDGPIITSRGLGTAVEFSLAIIASFCGMEKADSIRKSIVAPSQT